MADIESKLKPLIIFLSLTGACKPFQITKKNVIVFVLYLVFQLSIWIWALQKGIWCYVIDESSTIEKLGLFFTVIIASCHASLTIILGLVYFPKKLNSCISTWNEINSDPYFNIKNNQLNNVKKNCIISATVVITLCTIFVAVNDPHSGKYCIYSPNFGNDVYLWINALYTLLMSITYLVHRFSYLYLHLILVNTIKREFCRCDQEVKKVEVTSSKFTAIVKIKKRYIMVCRMVEKVDDLFMPFSSSLFTSSFITICLAVYSLSYGSMPLGMYSVYAVFTLMFITEMGYLLIQGSILHEASKISLKTLLHIDTSKMDQGTTTEHGVQSINI
ncbi:hypothetical protein LOTGIDRAFT_172086 [Lottia gigantea]|uniref:Uncharacterized protein n=1 Tax=Lottia gigantea TaxID=225164 RepID=V4AEK1_LOTGI|nr:hypothetical protein LOTGIDRAFT_172086 [Lottia gigantea]ESP02429.1 hypothetical protein LOTGIDRAFT_172086 [Lottia gigantea]